MLNIKVHSSTLGLGRSILALGTMLTFLFNSVHDLFPPYSFIQNKDLAHGIQKINFFYLFNYNQIWIPYLLSILILALVIIGIYPKITCILHSWVAYSIYYSMLIVEGGDQITAILTLLLIPLCLTDKRKNHWINNENAIIKNQYVAYFVSTAFLFLKFQMAILYLDASIEKLKVTEWLDGTAVYYWFNHNVFGAPYWMRYLLNNLFANQYFVTAVSWGVIFLELSLFTGLFIKQRYKYILFFIAFLFHILIFLTHGLPTFWIAMTGGLIFYLFSIELNWKTNVQRLIKNLNFFPNG